MKTFREFLNDRKAVNEMSKIDGQLSRNGYSGEDDWNTFFRDDKRFTKLVKDKITSKKLKLYRHMSFFFLTDSDDNYIASIDFEEKKLNGKNAILINTGNSKIKGHYKILLYEILGTDIDYIFSGTSTSQDARKFWLKLMKAGDTRAKAVVLFNNSVIEDYDSNEEYDWTNGRFGICENGLNESIDESDQFLEKICPNGIGNKFYTHEYAKRYQLIIELDEEI